MKTLAFLLIVLWAAPALAQTPTYLDEDVNIGPGPILAGVNAAAEGYEYRLKEGGVEIQPWTALTLGTDVPVFAGMAGSGRTICVEARAWNYMQDGTTWQYSAIATDWEGDGTACRSFPAETLPPSAPILRY